MNYRPALFCAIALSALLLAACGQKGPLYLPEEAETTPPAEGGTEPAAEDTQGE
ncbi:LPS translocon maturation chaperone LptM [Marinimicrobium agarilyticum]|uniref:LPS translocon maturation chaperone LptM n=1 Tax=Marinimicrobium agarilyticum TaxID=306546 RepID=UPI000429169F|nr:lipoprotein [Marinimicrobium agarilyticum]